jgi:hypothetical protein
MLKRWQLDLKVNRIRILFLCLRNDASELKENRIRIQLRATGSGFSFGSGLPDLSVFRKVVKEAY